MINGVTEAAAPTQSASMDGLDKDAFLKLLVAQLRYQNPMNPLDGQEYLAQAAQFAVVERLDGLAKAQAESVAYQQITFSSSLVGLQVTGEPSVGGGPVTGTVSAVRFQGGNAVLLVDGWEIPIGAVETIEQGVTDTT